MNRPMSNEVVESDFCITPFPEINWVLSGLLAPDDYHFYF